MSHKTNAALILFKKTISLLLIFNLVFPPSLLMAMDSGGKEGASLSRRAASVPPAKVLATTTVPDGREAPSRQDFEVQSNNSGIELSSFILFVSSASGAISRNHLDGSIPLTALSVVYRPPSPSVSVDHRSNRFQADISMDSISLVKQPSRNQVSFSISVSSHPLISSRSSYPSSPSNQVREVFCPPPGNQNYGSIEEEYLDVFMNPLDTTTTGLNQGYDEFPKVSEVPHGHRPFKAF